MILNVLMEKILCSILGDKYREKKRRKRFRALLYHAYDNSLFYRRLYQQHGIKRDDLRDINISDLPIITKQMIIDNYDDIFTDSKLKISEIKKWLSNEHPPCSNYMGKYIPVFTSGSTGDSAIFMYDKNQWEEIVVSASLDTLTLKDIITITNKDFIIASIVSNNTYATGVNMFRRNALFRDKKEISVTDSQQEIMQQLNTIQPKGLICYANIISDICEGLKSGVLKISPKYILATGEYLPPLIHEEIKNELPNCKIFDSYIATETLSMGFRDSTEKDFKLFTANNIIELLDKSHSQVKQNEIGIVTVTVLRNYVMPLIRYQLSDSATSRDILSSKMLGITTFSSFKGRTTKRLPIKDANDDIQKINNHLLSGFLINGIHKFQFISNELNKITFLYTAEYNLDEKIRKKLVATLKKYNAAETVMLKIKKVGSINPESNGKTLLIKIGFNL